MWQAAQCVAPLHQVFCLDWPGAPHLVDGKADAMLLQTGCRGDRSVPQQYRRGIVLPLPP